LSPHFEESPVSKVKRNRVAWWAKPKPTADRNGRPFPLPRPKAEQKKPQTKPLPPIEVSQR
jgi:hypothetical protein